MRRNVLSKVFPTFLTLGQIDNPFYGPVPFHPDEGDVELFKAKIRAVLGFYTSYAMAVTVSDGEGNIVYSDETPVTPDETGQAWVSFTWDGKDNDGNPVPPGDYAPTFIARGIRAADGGMDVATASYCSGIPLWPPKPRPQGPTHTPVPGGRTGIGTTGSPEDGTVTSAEDAVGNAETASTAAFGAPIGIDIEKIRKAWDDAKTACDHFPWIPGCKDNPVKPPVPDPPSDGTTGIKPKEDTPPPIHEWFITTRCLPCGIIKVILSWR